MVDWGLARQIASLAAGRGGGGEAPFGAGGPLPRLAAGRGGEEEPPFDAVALSLEMEPVVAGYTRLALSKPTPPGEVVSRSEWAAVNLDMLSHILDPVAGRLDERLSFAGPLAGALR